MNRTIIEGQIISGLSNELLNNDFKLVNENFKGEHFAEYVKEDKQVVSRL